MIVIAQFPLTWALGLAGLPCGDWWDTCWGLSRIEWWGYGFAWLFLRGLFVFAAAAMVGFRRGYDWMLVGILMGLGLALPNPLVQDGAVTATWFSPGTYTLPPEGTDWLTLAIVFFQGAFYGVFCGVVAYDYYWRIGRRTFLLAPRRPGYYGPLQEV